MKDRPKAGAISRGRRKVRWFWPALIVAVLLTITGILLGDIYEAHQTSATL
jgi:cytochrome b subunit of formate dehydrogenase